MDAAGSSAAVRGSVDASAEGGDETRPSSEELITLNVGGQIFQTTSTTLRMDEQSMLAAMFSSRNHHPRVIDGAYFIDRDPAYFRPVLNFLRTNQVVVDPNINSEGVLAEAMYFGVQSMVDALHSMHEETRRLQERGQAELTRRDVIRIVATAGSISARIRLQGVNLSGLDLSHLDLGNVNLAMADLSHCDLSFTTLINSSLAKCNLSHARMIHCNCNQAHLVGADLRGADLTSAHFCDADMTGCDLRGTDLLSSNFTGASLRNVEGLTDLQREQVVQRGGQF